MAMPPTIRAIFSLDIWLLLLFSIRVGWSTPSMPDASRRLKYRLDIEMIALAYPARPFWRCVSMAPKQAT
jgi:hypothetical protein